jgi:hypothetical protein
VRWLLLYARSRRLTVAVTAVVAGAAVLYVPARLWWHGQVDVLQVTFAITLGVTVSSVGLVGADPALDRGASFGWPPRRAGHLVVLWVLGTAVALALTGLLGSQVPAGVVVRDVGGQVGLAGVGACLFGGSFAWSLPFASLVLATLPVDTGTTSGQVAAWLVLPADTVPATVTGVVVGAVGLCGYAVFGRRRA